MNDNVTAGANFVTPREGYEKIERTRYATKPYRVYIIQVSYYYKILKQVYIVIHRVRSMPSQTIAAS